MTSSCVGSGNKFCLVCCAGFIPLHTPHASSVPKRPVTQKFLKRLGLDCFAGSKALGSHKSSTLTVRFMHKKKDKKFHIGKSTVCTWSAARKGRNMSHQNTLPSTSFTALRPTTPYIPIQHCTKHRSAALRRILWHLLCRNLRILITAAELSDFSYLLSLEIHQGSLSSSQNLLNAVPQEVFRLPV